jgi:TRAP-type C4-dicarboxylate transport system substrate-binding protein
MIGISALAVQKRARGQSTARLRLAAYLSPQSHSVLRIVKPWKELVERESNGRISFDFYAGGSLGRSPYTQYDLVRAGIPEIAFAQPNYTTGQFPQLQLLEAPFLARSAVECSVSAWRLCESGIAQGFEDVKLLGIWSAEPGLLFTRVPMTGFDDIKTLKIRSAGRLEGEFIESLGATAESMHPADVYEGMRRHTIHGSVQGWVSLQTFQVWRVSTHVHTAPFGAVLFALMMHKGAWDRLPDDLQEVFHQTGGMRLALLGGDAYDQRVVEIERKHRDEKTLTFVESTEADLERLRSSTKPLIDAWIARTPRGAEAYQSVQDTLTQLRRRERML